MEAVVGPETRIASLCNGITSEQKIAERFGWQRTVLGICQGMDAVFLNNELTYGKPGEIRFGAAPDTDPAVVADIADLYSRVGIAHVVEPDIKRRMWTKLMMNVGVNQTCMVHGGTYGSATERGSEQRRSLVAAMREARVVANAESVAIAESDLSQMVELLETLDPAGMPSMAQDRIARRKTEVEEFSGTICRLAAERRHRSSSKRMALPAYSRNRGELVAACREPLQKGLAPGFGASNVKKPLDGGARHDGRHYLNI